MSKTVQPTAKPALLPLVLEGFFSRLSFGFIAFALPLYAHSLGMSIAEIGILVSVNLMVSTVAKPVMGRVVDWMGQKQAALVGIGSRSLLTLAFTLTALPWQLLGIQAARGVAKSVRDPAMHVLLAEQGGKRALATAFAWYQTAKSAAGALGKAAAGILITLTASDYGLVFLVAFAFSVLPLLIVARYVPKSEKRRAPEAQERQAVRQESEAQPQSGRIAPRVLLPFMTFGFLASNTAQMLRGLFPLLAVEYAGLNEAQAGVIYLVSTVVVLTAGPLFGWLSDHVSRKAVLMIRGVGNALASLIYVYAPSFAGFLVGKGVDDAGKAAFKPSWGAIMAEVAARDPRTRGRTMGVLGAAEDAGSVSGPIIGALLWNSWGVATMLVVRVGFAVVAEVSAWYLLHRPSHPAGRHKDAEPLGQSQRGSAQPEECDKRMRKRAIQCKS